MEQDSHLSKRNDHGWDRNVNKSNRVAGETNMETADHVGYNLKVPNSICAVFHFV